MLWMLSFVTQSSSRPLLEMKVPQRGVETSGSVSSPLSVPSWPREEDEYVGLPNSPPSFFFLPSFTSLSQVHTFKLFLYFFQILPIYLDKNQPLFHSIYE